VAIVQSDGALAVASPSLVAGRYGGGYLGGSLPWYSGAYADYASIYRTQPNLRLVVNFFARNIAQLNLRAFERVSETERKSLGDSRLAKLLRTPNPIIKWTHYRFIHALISDLKTYDVSIYLKTRNEVSGDLRLWRLPPQFMSPEDGNLWAATNWRFSGLFSSQPIFSADDLLVIHGYNPDDMRVGLSPIESIRQTLAEGEAASKYREQFWNSGAKISGVIERPATGQGTPRWSETAKRRFLSEWTSSWTGAAPGAGGTPLLEDGMHFSQVAFSAKDSEYIAARKLGREEVASFYHLSPLFVGILENANFSNVREQHRHLYQDTLGPDLTQLEQEFHLQLLPEFSELDFDTTYLEFDFASKLKGAFEEEAGAIQTAVGAPWLTRNEARASQNKPPIEGGDELVTPLNVLIGGQASPTDSAPELNARPSTFKALDHGCAIKDASELPDDVKDWFDAHVEMLTSTFGRQENAVVAALGGGSSIESVWDDARWNGELKADFLDLATQMGTDIGGQTAEALDGTYDPEAPGVNDYLEENSRIASEGVNGATKQAIADLDAEDDGFLDSVRNVFAVAASSRAIQIGITRVTGVGNFARHEGAKQAGAVMKVWQVRSSNSRHPRLDGEKVGMDEEFSNGARWPGDHSLREDQRAGCTCAMDFER
jgi:HK97 family phage portal protein